MPTPPKIVLSASRRTDIPAFYMDWFMDQIDSGAFSVRNPYNGRFRHVMATSNTIHTIVFWSKNYRPFIAGGYGKILEKMGFHLFFNFTINSKSLILEPNVPPLSERLCQLATLAKTYSPNCVSWRFDPICHYQTSAGKMENNLHDFDRIADHAGKIGITRCITSFMDLYPKIQRRTKKKAPITFAPIPLQEQKRIAVTLQKKIHPYHMRLSTCCEKDLQRSLPNTSGINAAACVPNDLLMSLFGGNISLKKDRGQRIASGCGCKVSVDIGDYHRHPCFHNCLYCYANPAEIYRETPNTPSETRSAKG